MHFEINLLVSLAFLAAALALVFTKKYLRTTKDFWEFDARSKKLVILAYISGQCVKIRPNTWRILIGQINSAPCIFVWLCL